MSPSLKSLLSPRRSGANPDAALAAAGELVAEGRSSAAIELLTDANRKRCDPRLERRLVEVRHGTFAELGPPVSEPAAPTPFDPARLEDGVPIVDVDSLNAEGLRGAIVGHGSLLVRGLVPARRTEELASGIDRAFEGRDADSGGAGGGPTPWFDPFDPGVESISAGRRFVSDGSGMWLADSPRLLFDLLELFEEVGLRETITSYLGERPALSVNKGTLRRVPPEGGTEWWHQDGAFLGEGIRSLNVWLSLSHCGRDAPGLDVVTRRLDRIVETGTEDADFDWSVGSAVVERVAGGDIARPVFEPGDALLFDHLCLHRTATEAEMTRTRYATETWFFAPSAYPNPQQQVPLVL